MEPIIGTHTGVTHTRPMWKYTPWHFGGRYLNPFWYDNAASAVEDPTYDGHTVGPAIPLVQQTISGIAAVLLLLPFLGFMFASKDQIPIVPSALVFSVLLVASGIMLVVEHKVRKYSIVAQLAVLEYFESPFGLCHPTKFLVWVVHATAASLVENLSLISKCFRLATVWKCELVSSGVKLVWTVSFATLFLQWGYAYALAKPRDPASVKYVLRLNRNEEPESYETLLVKDQNHGSALSIYARVARMVSVYDPYYKYLVKCSELGMHADPALHSFEHVKKESVWFLISQFLHSCSWLGLQIQFMLSTYTLNATAEKEIAGLKQAFVFLILTLPVAMYGGYSTYCKVSVFEKMAKRAFKNISGGASGRFTFDVPRELADQGLEAVYEAFEQFVRDKEDNLEQRIDIGDVFLVKDGELVDWDLIEEEAPAVLVYRPPEYLEYRQRVLRDCVVMTHVLLGYLAVFIFVTMVAVFTFAYDIYVYGAGNISTNSLDDYLIEHFLAVYALPSLLVFACIIFIGWMAKLGFLFLQPSEV